ncbi:uncharacterized protein LOC110220744 [Phascolarctos cinereus]
MTPSHTSLLEAAPGATPNDPGSDRGVGVRGSRCRPPVFHYVHGANRGDMGVPGCPSVKSRLGLGAAGRGARGKGDSEARAPRARSRGGRYGGGLKGRGSEGEGRREAGPRASPASSLPTCHDGGDVGPSGQRVLELRPLPAASSCTASRGRAPPASGTNGAAHVNPPSGAGSRGEMRHAGRTGQNSHKKLQVHSDVWLKDHEGTPKPGELSSTL